MTKRAYYFDRSFEVSDKNRWVEVYVLHGWSDKDKGLYK